MKNHAAQPTKKFDLGEVVATPGALAALGGTSWVYDLIDRHLGGDWGEVDREDWAANDRALLAGARLLSAYTVSGTKVWVITEADRSATTVLLPEEY